MKKALALALSLFLAISTACKPAPIQPTPDTLDSKQTTLLISDNEEQATRQNRLEFIPIYPCNGDFYQSKARYLITDNGTLMISVDAWNESFEIFQSISLKDSQHYTFSLALQESSGWLFFANCAEAHPIIHGFQFFKGHAKPLVALPTIQSETVPYMLFCGFTNEHSGYLFSFREEVRFASGALKLSELNFMQKCEDIWSSVLIQKAPVIPLKESPKFVKMINQNIGLISGRYYADDYSFCTRTLLTKDGGENWDQIAELPKMDHYWPEDVTDFREENGIYILTVSYHTDHGYETLEYYSDNLQDWALSTHQ